MHSGEYLFAFMIPCAGFLTDIAVLALIWSLRGRRPHDAPLMLLHGALAPWNLEILALFVAPNEAAARQIVFVANHALPLIGLGFVWSACALSGRNVRKTLLVGSLGIVGTWAIIHYSYWFTPDNSFFLAGVTKYRFGYYPRIGPGARFYSLFMLACVSTGFFFLLRPGGRAAAPGLRLITALYLLFWLAASTNFLVVHGVDVFPLGGGADAALLGVVALLVYRRDEHTAAARYLHAAALLLITASFGLLGAYVLAEFVIPAGPFGAAAAALAAALSSVLAYRLLSGLSSARPGSAGVSAGRPLSRVLEREFALTPAEIGVCNLLQAGFPRAELTQRLGIRPGTLKQHLNSIYSKMLPKDGTTPTGRDKLQRLTVLLGRLAGSHSERGLE